jgi:8-oxo-dGTP diphosphatase
MGDGAAAEHHQVVAGIVIRQAQVLLCHRSPDRAWYPDVWDLPGGHIAAGETPLHALVPLTRRSLA